MEQLVCVNLCDCVLDPRGLLRRRIAFGNAAQTAQNIMAHEPLFRLGIASNLTVSTGPLSGYYQWLPALVFQVVLGLWLLLRGAATHAEDQKPAGR